MGDDELEERLESMSTRPTPPVDPGFGNRLESELRRQFAEPATGRGSIMDVLFRPGVVVGMAAAIIAVVLIVAQRDTPVDLVMDSAEGTSISIPGQSETIDGVAGLSLPEGSRIVVAQEGSAVVADVVLDGGTTAEIVDGQLNLVDVAPETTRPGTTVPGTTLPGSQVPDSTAPDTTTSETTAPTTMLPDSIGPSSTVPQTTVPKTTVPETTVPETTVPATVSPTTVPVDTRSTTTQAPGSDVLIPVRLTLEPTDNARVVLRWQIRAESEDEVAYWTIRARSNEVTRTVAVVRQANVRVLRLALPDQPTAYRVLGHSAEGALVAASAWQRLVL